MTRLHGSPGWRAVPLLLVLLLLAAACGGGGDPATTAAPATTPTTAAPATTTTDTTIPVTSGQPTTTAVATEPSQTATDAARDGVIPELAALPLTVRVDIMAEAPAAEGIWAISRLTAAADEFADGCRLGAGDGKYPTDFICTFEYGELLLLDNDRARILRAYPLPGVPAEFLAVTDEAVYCGRHGEIPMPDAMVCRVDRATLSERVMVYPQGLDSLIVQPCYYPPATWGITEETLEMTTLAANADGVFVRALDGSWTGLDPMSLEIVGRNVTLPLGIGP